MLGDAGMLNYSTIHLLQDGSGVVYHIFIGYIDYDHGLYQNSLQGHYQTQSSSTSFHESGTRREKEEKKETMLSGAHFKTD